MKKMILTSSLLVPTLILGGCSSAKGVQSNQHQVQIIDQSNNAQDENTSEKSYTSLEALLKDVEANLKTDVPFVAPTDIPKDDNTYYSAAIDNKSAGYSVIIFQTDKPLQINDAELNDLGEENQLVTLTGTKYDSAQSAQEETGYQEVQQENIDLGHGIKGLQEGAAGSKYLSWNEGRWFLNLRANTDNAINLEDDAKDMVEFLETNTLPIPNKYGQISVDYENEGHNAAIWQNGQDVYEAVPNTSDPVEALKMITSVEN
ncbi:MULTISPECIES: hypothetical protein [Bacillus]|uniref:Lipoprotein n=1 Tax=Bacillus capparidis TaxID=1840411 RepID=A0ABS4CX31_9BACI|nr:MULTISPECIES: hypothetical protein [Bacillus]MBP1082088.1 hypothetical protein [Bacillus capparidis]MED1096712.1 hypothetical protein [Bacillus capparidis]